MADKPKKVTDPKDELRLQAEKVAKMLRTRDRLRGKGLNDAVDKYRVKLEKKRVEIEKELGGEVDKLRKMTP